VVKLPQMRLLSQQLLLDVLDALADEINIGHCTADSTTLSSQNFS